VGRHLSELPYRDKKKQADFQRQWREECMSGRREG
jgi:hypothetical protein